MKSVYDKTLNDENETDVSHVSLRMFSSHSGRVPSMRMASETSGRKNPNISYESSEDDMYESKTPSNNSNKSTMEKSENLQEDDACRCKIS